VFDKYTVFSVSSSTLLRGIANLVIFLGFGLVDEVGVGAALSVSTASSIKSSTVVFLRFSFLLAQSSTLIRRGAPSEEDTAKETEGGTNGLWLFSSTDVNSRKVDPFGVDSSSETAFA
jgi:hypothetical protein